MANMFSPAPWWNSKKSGTGFVPGPTRVPVVNGPKAPASQPPAAMPAVRPPPAAPAAPPGRIPAGNKADCPVCNRGFGKKGF